MFEAVFAIIIMAVGMCAPAAHAVPSRCAGAGQANELAPDVHKANEGNWAHHLRAVSWLTICTGRNAVYRLLDRQSKIDPASTAGAVPHIYVRHHYPRT